MVEKGSMSGPGGHRSGGHGSILPDRRVAPNFGGVTSRVPARPRLSVGEWISAGGGLLLVLSLLAPWEHRPASGPELTDALTGLRSFGVLTAVLGAAAVVPVVHAVRRGQGHGGVRPLVVVCCGAVALTAILFGMATSLGVDSEPGGGLYAGLLGATAIAVGGALRLFLFRPAAG